MMEAKREFEKTAEAFRVTLADAELAMKRRDFEAALAMLRLVPPDSVYNTRAKMKVCPFSYRCVC